MAVFAGYKLINDDARFVSRKQELYGSYPSVKNMRLCCPRNGFVGSFRRAKTIRGVSQNPAPFTLRDQACCTA